MAVGLCRTISAGDLQLLTACAKKKWHNLLMKAACVGLNRSKQLKQASNPRVFEEVGLVLPNRGRIHKDTGFKWFLF